MPSSLDGLRGWGADETTSEFRGTIRGQGRESFLENYLLLIKIRLVSV